jgi:hypothetical protein
MFGSGSKEECTTSFMTEELSRREELTTHTVVSFIKINGVDFNVCLLNFVQGVISSEDDNILASSPCSVREEVNLLRVSSMEELNITTVNVHHMSIVIRRNQLKKLLAKLFCKKNTRSNNNKSRIRGATTTKV